MPDWVVKYSDTRRQRAESRACEGISTEALDSGVLRELVDACKYGLIGISSIVLLHNAAAMLGDIDPDKFSSIIAGLQKKGELEYAALAKLGETQ